MRFPVGLVLEALSLREQKIMKAEKISTLEIDSIAGIRKIWTSGLLGTCRHSSTARLAPDVSHLAINQCGFEFLWSGQTR